MRKSEIKVGGLYEAKVNNAVVVVRVDAIREIPGRNPSLGRNRIPDTTAYDVTNTKTGRKTTFRSAAKFRGPAVTKREVIKEAGALTDALIKSADRKLAESDPNPKVNSALTRGDLKAAETEMRNDTLGQRIREVLKNDPNVSDAPSPEVRVDASDLSPSEVTELTRPEATADRLRVEERAARFPSNPQVDSPYGEPTIATPLRPATGLAAKLTAPHQTSSSSTSSAPHLIIEARAGTGKTTTLIEGLKKIKGVTSNHPAAKDPMPQQAAIWSAMAKGPAPRFIGFCAFNKSIATELQERVPKGCDAMTLHSLGFRAINKALPGLKVDSYNVQNIISRLLEKDIRDLRKDCPVLLQATEELVGLCKQNLVCPADAGFPAQLGRLAAHYGVELSSEFGKNYQEEIFALVPRVLEACLDPKNQGAIDFNDMVWLPTVLNLPMFRYDLLLIDEFQDTNRAQQELAKRAGKRLVMCGDPCQPPGTMVTLAGTPGSRWHEAIPGKRVPIEDLREGDMIVGYSPKDGSNHSNRVVEGISENLFDGRLVEIETTDGIVSRYTPEHHCYASFGPLRDHYVVYLMKRGLQFRIGSCQLNYGASGNGIVHRLRTEGGEAAWILESYPEKREARLREMELSYQYNIPQVVFSNGDQGYILDSEGLRRFWKFVDNNAKTGLRVIQDFGLEWSRPVAVPGEQYHQSFKRPMIFAAANLRDGMEVRTEDGRWVQIKVRRPHYYGPVYSLSVSHDKLYMADGIVTHNCQAIYGFAGADSKAMTRMEEELGATPAGCEHLYLTVTRRCGKAIVDEARQIVPDFEAHPSNGAGAVTEAKYPLQGPRGERQEIPFEQTYMASVLEGDFILCRTNAPLVSQCFRFIKRGRKATIQGRDIGQGLISTVQKQKASTIRELIEKLNRWYESEDAKERAKKNPSEAKLLALSDRFECLMCFCSDLSASAPVSDVEKKIQAIFTDDKNAPGVRLSSIHKAKGLESTRVFFLQIPEGPCPHPMASSDWEQEQEQNLLYVGITRAKAELIWVY